MVMAMAAATAAAAGCGSSASGAYAEIARAYCERAARCGGGDAAAIERCRAKLEAALHASAWNVDEAQAAGRVTIDGGKLGACTAAIRDGDCSQFFADASACNSVLVGKVAVGGACAESSECVSGATCARATSTSGCPGTCTALPTAGQPCAGGKCGTGLYCGGTAAMPVCAARLGEGSPCSSATQCQEGLTCREPAVGAAKICRAYGTAGQPCGGFLGHDCQRGLDCDTSRSPAVCITRVGEGQPCRASSNCTDGLVCIAGSCAKPLAIGATCTPSGSGGCAFGLVCDRATSTCAAPTVREGTSCSTSSECEEGTDAKALYCDAGTCRAKPLLGESCTPPASGTSDPCAAGDCSPTTKVCALVCE
jgi:hypothetical protein